MRLILALFILSFTSLSYGQLDQRISTMDFVQILNNNKKEVTYYYQNNWKVLRDMAIKKGYIESYQVLETPFNEEQPFEIILITTYANKEQYDQREDHFQELIKEKGALDLLNEKKPGDFRKTLFNREIVRHWETPHKNKR
ncbi:hypothetical protein [Aquimarina spongiae]|uniref:NIPSNAP protein n=1 Tax=Aquimarina spongiae TaxID=570521 RepID=A0A1M6I371_9FLAO|nr:hypothetical protein [Aquimarina spongiae]SHJ28923.1 hypothetical protein SAMN04488508_10789 [Aquimarina spongiae]